MDTPGFKTIIYPAEYGELSADALRHANLLVLAPLPSVRFGTPPTRFLTVSGPGRFDSA
jgi:hypothetical protein